MEPQLATVDDLNSIVKIFKAAAENMIKNNIFQWDEIYPSEDILAEDIQKHQMYKITFDGAPPQTSVPGEAALDFDNIISLFVLNNEYDREYANGIWEYTGDNFMVIHRLCVNTVYQNKGFGTKTMMCIEEYLKNTGIESIRLDAFSKNQAALKLYNKLGYKKTGEANWRKGLFYLFEKKL
jgi:ribosomal protein S18 acetylase RimI-like enzyme